MSGKVGSVNNAWHECAGQEVVSKAVSMQATSGKGRKSEERCTCAIRLFNNLGTTAMIEALDQISFLEVNYSNCSSAF